MFSFLAFRARRRFFDRDGPCGPPGFAASGASRVSAGVTAGGSGAGTVSLAGSLSLNEITTTVDAHVGPGADILTPGAILIQASSTPDLLAISGSGSGAGIVAGGAASL